MKNKKMIISIISVIIMVITLVVVIRFSYGFFVSNDHGEEQSFTTGVLAVDYRKKTDVINLENMYPMNNKQGLRLESHEFTVKNNGTMKAKYQIRLEVKTNMKKMLDLEYIKISYSRNNQEYEEPILLSSLNSNLVIVSDQLLDSGDMDTYGIKMWIDEDAPNEIQGKEFSARIVVDSLQELASTYQVDAIPVIYLNEDEKGNKDIVLKKGEEYTELGVNRIEDDYDNLGEEDVEITYEYYNPLTEEIETIETINKNKIGIYYVTYTVEDSYGNIGKAVRVVNIKKRKETPVIELVGSANVVLTEGEEYTELGVTVENNNRVAIIGEVKTDSIGVYDIRYIVIDEDNNLGSVVRRITINERPEAPEIAGGDSNWVSEAPTIYISKEGSATSGVGEYEYYKVTTSGTPTAPDAATVATGTLQKDATDLQVSNEGTTYVYYRTVSNNGFKSEWTGPQVVNLDTANIPVGTIYTFPYQEGNQKEQELKIPTYGYYQLEVWGAQGGHTKYDMKGYGGYSKGTVFLTINDTLYVNVGGAGQSSQAAGESVLGGYNGGGNANAIATDDYVSSGGGATHIATVSGELSTLEQYRDTYDNYLSNEILIVAGGGGGIGYDIRYSNQHDGYNSGGGYKTNTIKALCGWCNSWATVQGATQTSGNAFGQGGINHLTSDSMGAGGGWYGGNAGIYSTGGTGYIGSPKLFNKVMYCYSCPESTNDYDDVYPNLYIKTKSTTDVDSVPTANYAKEGNGYARITYLGKLNPTN